ncbi:MAG: hypothetical protein AAF581_05245 [Planctomycetota bacterium]
MTRDDKPDISATETALESALADGQLEAAQQLLAAYGETPPAALARPAARLWMERQRWQRAAQAWAGVTSATTEERCNERLCRNLAVLETNHPTIAGAVVAATNDDRFTLHTSDSGALTIAFERADGSQLLLSAQEDPIADVRQVVAGLQSHLDECATLALCGIGDGYLLAELAQQESRSALGLESQIYVIVPDPAALLTCLMLHDYSGDDGPLCQPRFRWYVGADWLTALQTDLAADLYLPLPKVQVQLPPHGTDTAKQLEAATDKLQRRDDRFRRRIDQHYTTVEPTQLAALLGDDPPRRPRIALATTRFTTVLQYATRDLATTLGGLGWDVEIIIEPTTEHRVTKPAIREVLARFRPDFFLQIDHLRHEHGDLLPAALPFICWAQDLLPNLLDANAAAATGPYDYVLTFDVPLFVDQYGYPQERCIAMPFMLALPARTGQGTAAASPATHDLVYVSNMSSTPERAFEWQRNGAPAALRSLLDACWEQLRQQYAGDFPVSQRVVGHGGITDLLNATATQTGVHLPTATAARLASHILFPLNSLLFRQEGLRWVAAAASELGSDLAVYGRGWELHPDFAPYARGVVEHGAALQELTQRSRINLNLEPYPCVAHQRLLDGLAAGGFFLIREHTSNRVLQQLANLLDQYATPAVHDLASARSQLPAAQQGALEELVTLCLPLCYATPADPVRLVRSYQEAKVLISQQTSLPYLDAVSFASPAQCRVRIEHFLGAAKTRQSIAAAQWDNIRDRLSFPVAMKRVIGEIRRHLAG